MPHRVVAVLIFAFSGYVLYVAVQALVGSAEFADLMAAGVRANGMAIDPVNFLAHWRASLSVLVVAGILGIVASVAMFLLRPWSWLIILGVAGGFLVASVVSELFGLSRYAFEASEPIQSFVFIIVAIVSFVAYRSWKQSESHASER